MQARVTEEVETLVSERATLAAVLESRARELAIKRDAELKRIEQWAEQQRVLIHDLFGAMLAENQADIDRNAAVLKRSAGETAAPRAPLRSVNKAAAAFAKAAE